MFFEIFAAMRLLVILSLISSVSFGQNYFLDHFGGQVGAVFQIGSHKNAVGLTLNGYYQDYFFQVNAGQQFIFNARDLGTRTNFVESRTSIGALLLGGKRDNTIDPFIQPLNHQSNYRNAIGYSYIWYLDKAGTSQRSGAWGLHFSKFSVYHENDVFGGQGKDRYRSGDFQLAYRHDNLRFSAGIRIWTGETSKTKWIKTSTDVCPNGYKLLEDNAYGGTSHGILYGGIQGALIYNQYASFYTGVDSEVIRHMFQNRLMHDLPFLPKSFKRTTPHYPMLDDHGCAVFDNKDRRKDKWFIQTGLNGNWSY